MEDPNEQSTIVQPGQIVFLGHQGENLARRVVFDLSDLRKRYPQGHFALAAQRKGDALPYPAARTDPDGDALVWTLTDADTAIAGYGRCELRCYDGETLAKSEVWQTFTLPALAEYGEAPEAWADYVAQVQRVGTAVQEAQRHGPMIGGNGTWMLWDTETAQYTDSGLPARGETGAQGEQGDPGEAVIDATLSASGEAADAKATGDRLRALDELADEVTEALDWNLIRWGFTTKTIQGATFTVNDDGTLTVNGTVNTANAHNGIKLLDAADIDHTAAYTVKCAVVSEDAPVSGDTTTRWTWWGYGETASGEVTACRFGVPSIIPEGMSVFLLVSKRASFHNQRQTVQVYKGSEPLPYVPPNSCTAVDAVARHDSETRAQKKLIAAVEASATATANYVTGDLVIVGDTLCKVTENIAAGGTITDGVNVRETTVAAELALAAASGDGDSSITVDTALSASSTNPVENRAIQAALDGKGAATSIPASASISTAGVLSFANSAGTQLFTVQLPLYAGGVS